MRTNLFRRELSRRLSRTRRTTESSTSSSSSPALLASSLKRSLSSAKHDGHVKVTQHSQSLVSSTSSSSYYDLDREATTQLVDELLRFTRSLMDGENNINNVTNNSMQKTSMQMHHHLIAFSGGVDSSLVAALVQQSHDQHPKYNEQVKAILGISPAVPAEQIELAEKVAQHIGIELQKVPTAEGQDETYLANAGKACLACKTHLYSTLQAIVQHHHHHQQQTEWEQNNIKHMKNLQLDNNNNNSTSFRLYNGTNADDMQDETRLGLIAAREFNVASPLQHLPKAKVRQAARHLGLLNWNYAASPCLRSRLALGVTATAHHLQLMAQAERLVRTKLVSAVVAENKEENDENNNSNSSAIDETTNLRVRLLAGNKARIEIDEPFVNLTAAQEWKDLLELGDFSSVSVRAFRSGSVARKENEPSATAEEEPAPAAIRFG